MLSHLGFEGKAKHSARCLTVVNKALGSEIWPVIGETLEQDVDAYCKSLEARKTSSTMAPGLLRTLAWWE